MNCSDALALMRANKTLRMTMGQSGNISIILEDAGRMLQMKCIFNSPNNSDQIKVIRRVDSTLSNTFSWYPSLHDVVLGRYLGRPALFVLRPFLAGDEFSFTWEQTASVIEVIDVLTACEAADDVESHDYLSEWVDQFDLSMEGCLAELPPTATLLKKELGKWSQCVVAAAQNGSLPRPRLAHGDLHGRNVLFRGSNVIAIIDWDDCGFSKRPVDLGKAFWFFCRKERGHFRLDSVRARQFIRMARKSAFVSPAVLEAIPWVGAGYFLPRSTHLRFLGSRDSKLYDWYVGWVTNFWAEYENNLLLVEAILRE
jgi:phosphotransferase family enzyme